MKSIQKYFNFAFQIYKSPSIDPISNIRCLLTVDYCIKLWQGFTFIYLFAKANARTAISFHWLLKAR